MRTTINLDCGILEDVRKATGLRSRSQATLLALNPDFALGRGIRRTMPDFSVLKKFVRCPKSLSPFFVGKVSAVGNASFVSVLTPNAKSGLNDFLRRQRLRKILSGRGTYKFHPLTVEWCHLER